MAKITLEEYQDLKAQGKTDRDIALIKKIHPSNLPPLKKQWGIGTTRYDKVEKKHSENKTTPKENNVTTSDYESLQIQLENQKQITEIQASQIEKLQDDLLEAGKVCKRLNSEAAELRNKVEDLENVNAACDDVENEVASLQDKYNLLRNEYDIAINKQYHLDYTVANQKKRIEDLGKTLERYELENRAMRELLRQWI
jgi:chromosome segregation ATPase